MDLERLSHHFVEDHVKNTFGEIWLVLLWLYHPLNVIFVYGWWNILYQRKITYFLNMIDCESNQTHSDLLHISILFLQEFEEAVTNIWLFERQDIIVPSNVNKLSIYDWSLCGSNLHNQINFYSEIDLFNFIEAQLFF